MLLILLAITAVLIVAALYAASQYLERIVEKTVARTTGLHVTVGEVKLRPLQSRLSLRDIRVFNPPGFPDNPFLRFPVIDVEVYSGTIFDPEIRFREIHLDLAEASLFRNGAGVLNAEAVADQWAVALAARAAEGQKDGGAPSPGESREKSIHIERLLLSLGTIRYHDARHPEVDVAVDAGLVDKEFRDVRDFRALSMAVLGEILREAVKRALIKEALRSAAAGLIPTNAAGTVLEKAGAVLEKLGAKLKGIFSKERREEPAPQPPPATP